MSTLWAQLPPTSTNPQAGAAGLMKRLASRRHLDGNIGENIVILVRQYAFVIILKSMHWLETVPGCVDVKYQA